MITIKDFIPTRFARLQRAIEKRQSDVSKVSSPVIPYLLDSTRLWKTEQTSAKFALELASTHGDHVRHYRLLYRDLFLCAIFPRRSYGKTKCEVVIYRNPSFLTLNHLDAMKTNAVWRKNFTEEDSKQGLQSLLLQVKEALQILNTNIE